MPLIQKPRDPRFGQRRVRRKGNKRIRIPLSLLPETKAYIEATNRKMPAGRLMDAAIRLYRETGEKESTKA